MANRGECVSWSDLLSIREGYNTLWDLLKLEDRTGGIGFKYGFSSDTKKDRKEEIESLAIVQGFFNLTFDSFGDCYEIYFLLPPDEYATGATTPYYGDGTQTLGGRLQKLGTDYWYEKNNGYGPWVVYLKDKCFGCTGFGLQSEKIEYHDGRTIVCGGVSKKIDNPSKLGQCIWRKNDSCDFTHISEVPKKLCNFNFDWREEADDKLIQRASGMFPVSICADPGDPCGSPSKVWCCNSYAKAYYTEEWNDQLGVVCPGDKIYRRLKYISMGITGTEDEQTEDGKEQGIFEGTATQLIEAVHLMNILNRVKNKLHRAPLRKCEYDQCKSTPEDPVTWSFKDPVPTLLPPGQECIGERQTLPDSRACNVCEKQAETGEVICACQFNEIKHIVNKYIASTCSCYKPESSVGKTLVSFGPTSTCDCCEDCCCEGETGCSCDEVAECCCCPRDYKPELQPNGKCKCVSDPCLPPDGDPGGGSGSGDPGGSSGSGATTGFGGLPK